MVALTVPLSGDLLPIPRASRSQWAIWPVCAIPESLPQIPYHKPTSHYLFRIDECIGDEGTH